VTFISIHSVIIYVVFFGACMRCIRLCPLNPGVTLHDEIKSAIMVQRPSTLDTACSLALVQEEALASGRSCRAHQAPLRTTSKQDFPSSSLPKVLFGNMG
jgi:hypothetical protein